MDYANVADTQLISAFKLQRAPRPQYLDILVFIALFVFSFIHTITLIFAVMCLMLWIPQKAEGVLKIFIFLVLRGTVGPQFPSIDNLAVFKWVILLGLSGWMISRYFVLPEYEKSKLTKVFLWLFPYMIYNLFTGLLLSDLPFISILKLISFVVVFCGMLTAVADCYKTFDCMRFIYSVLGIYLLMCSYGFINRSYGYYKGTTNLFVGIVKHPNMLGILLVIFITLSVYMLNRFRGSGRYVCMAGLLYALVLMYFTSSRTAIFSAVALIVIAFIFSKRSFRFKLIVISFFILFLCLISPLWQEVYDFVYDIVFKYEADNILVSREKQIGRLIDGFLRSPIFGNGFCVPILGYKDYTVALSYAVESGNLFLALLSDGGIIGTILFLSFFLQIVFYKGVKKGLRLVLPAGVLLMNMGEMVFFSSNSIAPILFMILGAYLYETPSRDMVPIEGLT